MRRALSLPPSGFVAVMATAALATLTWDRGYRTLSAALLWLAAAFFVGIAATLAARGLARPRSLASDVTSPATAFGLFTLPAALALLADRLWVGGYNVPALGVWAAGVAALVAVGYGVPLLLITGEGGRLPTWVTPGWATPVLATQTLVAAATLLSERWLPGVLLFAALTSFLVAWGLYLVLGSWIAQRLLFGEVEPTTLTAHHWIPISALASSGFAATRLITSADRYELVESVRPVVEAFAVTAWTGCSAWFGLVLGLEVWRLRRLGLAGFVAPNAAFPVYAIAAYGITSHELSGMFGLGGFGWVAEVALWVGVAGALAAVVFTATWLAGASVAHEHG